jgi:hypothetical protein
LVTLLLAQGAANLKNLTRSMPRSIQYWTVLRMVKAGYWDTSALLDEMAVAALASLPPPADHTIYVIGDKTTKQKTGKKMPLAAQDANERVRSLRLRFGFQQFPVRSKQQQMRGILAKVFAL